MAAIGDGLAFELTKLRTLRSTYWGLATYLLVSLAVAVLTGSYLRTTFSGQDAEADVSFDPVATGHSGLRLGLIAVVVLAVLAVTSEYSTGTIRSSLAAVPRRGVFFASKMLAGAVVVAASSVVVVVLSFVATQVTLGSAHNASLTDEGVLRSIVGAVLYTTLLCGFAMGLAAMLRSSALTIGILVPLLFMVSTILSNLPGIRNVAQFLPDVAGGQILYQHAQAGTVLTPWTGLAVLAGWTVLAVAGGAWAVRRRDA